jgi:hypothetical protein
MQRRSFTFLDGCSRSRLCWNITRRPGTFLACCSTARTQRSELANPSRKLQSACCARQGTSPKPLAPFQQAFTRARGQAEVGNAFAITSTREKRSEKGLFLVASSAKASTPARLPRNTGPGLLGASRAPLYASGEKANRLFSALRRAYNAYRAVSRELSVPPSNCATASTGNRRATRPFAYFRCALREEASPPIIHGRI